MQPFTIIDLNDANIRVAKGEQILLNSPGYAVIKDDKIAFGSNAEKLTRIYPRNTHDDYWYRLSQDAIQSASNQIRHNADLAYMQLAEIQQQSGHATKWLFAVPASFDHEQLSLLLGLLKAANYEEVQLIDSALLASSKHLNKGEHAHLDMQLHQSVLTSLATDDKHRVVTSNILPDAGLLNIYGQCAKLISTEFINQSRFDPHHNAETEQLLFESIPGCLNKLTSSAIHKLDIEYQGKSYSANITRESIVEKLLPIYAGIQKHIENNQQLILSHRFGILPGFLDNLADAHLLDEFSLFKSVNDYSGFLLNTELNTNYISELPVIEKTEALTQSNIITTQTTNITHILVGDTAYSLNKQSCYINVKNKLEHTHNADDKFSIHFDSGQYAIQTENNNEVSLNGSIISGRQALNLGDNIKIAGTETGFSFIKVS